MGDRLWSWRVVGITPEALALFAQHDFKKPPQKGAVVRGHLVSRKRTAEQLFHNEEPLGIGAFFDLFLTNDCTVLMLSKQNPSRGDQIPEYIPIENPDAYLFPCASLMGYHHEEQEVEFLRKLSPSVRQG
ncbi:MAG: hypothetical protein OEL88_14420 [Sterolibacteriaceae bacterium MAG5]|nr:hypothetical protein [Candidatus Nitricoxidireducens bremensis]